MHTSAAAVCESPATSRAARTSAGVGFAAGPFGPRLGWLGTGEIPRATVPAPVLKLVQFGNQIGVIADNVGFNFNPSWAVRNDNFRVGVLGFDLFGKPRAIGVAIGGAGVAHRVVGAGHCDFDDGGHF